MGATWAELEAAAPDLAALGRRLFEARRVALIGTLRSDGSPRISPIGPYFLDGELVIGVMPSPKGDDLERDGRCTLHSPVTSIDGSDGEFKVHGRALPTSDPAIVEDADGWWSGRPAAEFRVYAIRIEEAVGVSLDLGRGRMAIDRWRVSTGVRRSERAYP